MNRDLVVGVVGAAILVAAMVGVFYYEKNNVAAAGSSSAATTNSTGPGATGSTAAGASTDKTVSFNETKMVNVTFTLKWTAASGRDTLNLSIAPSAGTGVMTGAAAASDSGTITITIPIAQNATGTVGDGDWKATVKFVSASAGLPMSPPVTPPAGTDASVTWTLTSSVESRA